MSEQESDSPLVKAFANFAQLECELGSEVSQLWQDAMDFFVASSPDKPRVAPHRRHRLARAAVLTAAAAFEAVTNYLSEQIARADEVGGRKLNDAEIDCLREKRKVLENGKIKERKQIYSSKDRFLLLFSVLSRGDDLGGKGRTDLETSFEIRDRLVHPKPGTSVDLLRDDTARKALLGFLMADVLLAHAWAGARDHKPLPAVGLAALRRPNGRDNGETTDGQGKIRSFEAAHERRDDWAH